ncbi:PAS domain-containing protein [Dongia rigui]|uniref:PAS domain-containing protein n=1 Tax=Dongia rigui TaxID=940149 RepID=A0ABU5DXV6_9PROT|nr:hypothetical protein [Dongia rigui]MDY0872156.1 hypothetical protein [Dongia rigui]
MTGFINYLDHKDPRIRAISETWLRLKGEAPFPVFDAAALAAFAPFKDRLAVVEIREEPGRKRPRYFVAADGPQIAAELGFDLTGRYLDEVTEMPEFQTMLESDYDTVRTSRAPRAYAEEHHLDGMLRQISGIQLPFGADGQKVDHILEVTYRLDQAAPST